MSSRPTLFNFVENTQAPRPPAQGRSGRAEEEAAYLDVPAGKKRKLLKALAERFRGNECFSRIGDFLDQHGIKHETFRWM